MPSVTLCPHFYFYWLVRPDIDRNQYYQYHRKNLIIPIILITLITLILPSGFYDAQTVRPYPDGKRSRM